MVGVKKIVLNREELRHPILDKLLSQYRSIEICVAGSAEHEKNGLVRSKMLVMAFKRKSKEHLACPNCGTILENCVLLKAKPRTPQPQEPSESSVQTEAQPQSAQSQPQEAEPSKETSN